MERAAQYQAPGKNAATVFMSRPRSGRRRAWPSLTSYVVVSGPGTMFPDAQSIRLDQVTDGLSNTLMVAESSNLQVPWTKPEDLDFRTMSLHINDKQSPSISSRHVKGGNVLYADGSCRFLNESIAADLLRSLLTIAGGEPVSDD